MARSARKSEVEVSSTETSWSMPACVGDGGVLGSGYGVVHLHRCPRAQLVGGMHVDVRKAGVLQGEPLLKPPRSTLGEVLATGQGGNPHQAVAPGPDENAKLTIVD